MNERGVVVTIVCALAIAVPVTAAATGDPLAQAKVDVAKLTADASSAKSTVAADATNGDRAQPKRDASAASKTLKTDWKVLLTDVTAARRSGGDEAELRSLLQAARAQVKGFRSTVRAALARTRRTAKQKRGVERLERLNRDRPPSQKSDDDGSGG